MGGFRLLSLDLLVSLYLPRFFHFVLASLPKKEREHDSVAG